ncbi:MAG TPA: ISNCY family transposase [Candidatus Tectomicrobia bacterium]
MTTPLGFDVLKGILHRRTAQWPDHRQEGPNTRYAIQDAALGAFGLFFTQSPSFLEYQRRLQHTKGHHNAQTLLGVEQIPCDNQVRILLDPIAPSHLDAVFVEVFAGLDQHRLLANFRCLGDQRLVALDGTTSFSSKAIHCQNCLTRQLSNGQTLSSHAAITPVIVCPGRSQVLALPPEYIMPQDGHAKQDCERAASKRWLRKHAAQVASRGATLLGDDLYSNQPWCALVVQHRCNFILTCKPDSHPTCYERVAFWQANDAMATREAHHWNGRFTEVTMVRYLNEVLLRKGDDAMAVNGFEITVVHAKTGAQLYHNSCITTHRLTAENVVAVAQAGRGRWKSENEHNNVLKTKGYHLEHNFGHGKRYLSAFLLSLNLLAFLFHTVLEWSDAQYALLRRVLARRQTFFQDVQAFMRYMVFDNWEHLMGFMIRGLALESPLDTS